MTPTACARLVPSLARAKTRPVAAASAPIRFGASAHEGRPARSVPLYRDPLVDLVAATATAARMGLLAF